MQSGGLVKPWGGSILIETVMTFFAISVFILFATFMILAAFLYYWMD
jgi:hypothetical protein